jgi:hypothetical protein
MMSESRGGEVSQLCAALCMNHTCRGTYLITFIVMFSFDLRHDVDILYYRGRSGKEV